MHQSSHFTVDDIVQLVPEKSESGDGLSYDWADETDRTYRFSYVGRKTVYEVSQPEEHHDHLVCEQCGHVEEFICPEIEDLQDSIASEYGFRLTRHEHVLTGLCPQCQETSEQKS